MKRLDVAGLLIDSSEVAVSVPVRTRGSGDHSTPVVLLSGLNAYRRAEGNSSLDGLNDSDGDGTADEILLSHIYEASATLETRAEDEVQSYNLASSLSDELAQYEEYPTSFNTALNSFSVGAVEQGGFQAPTPEPVFKHTVEISLDFNDEVAVPITTDVTGEPIETISDDITLS